jgi:hypothetical protein
MDALMDDLVTWLRKQIDDDERWALAANQPYEYADESATAPPTGVHWRWVHGPNWEPTTPDPAVNEFVTEPGESCNLATVEKWPSTTYGRTRQMPRVYADAIVEMDAAAGGHITRWDPARVLAEVDAKRRIIAEYERYAAERRRAMNGWESSREVSPILAALALPYADRKGYREEWKPA